MTELLAERRDEFVVATKYTGSRNPTDPNAAGNHPKNLVLSLETSLRRLRTDCIDVYWVHIWDRHTPIEETVRALDDVTRAGKVLYIGISDAPAWLVSRANTLAEWAPRAGPQPGRPPVLSARHAATACLWCPPGGNQSAWPST